MKIPYQSIKKVFPKLSENLYNTIVEECDNNPVINSTDQFLRFLAVCGHETGGFTVFEENLKYSANGLLKTFPKYFKSLAEAQAYAYNPQKIANRIYGKRMGNTNPDDGWKFRGRGFIQLTGKDNYTAYAIDCGDSSILTNPDVLLEPHHLVKSALWFWNIAKINKLVHFKDVQKAVNGGMIGYEHRLQLLTQLEQVANEKAN